MGEDTRVTPQESDEYDPPKAKPEKISSLESEDYDLHSKYYYEWDRNGLTENPFEIKSDSYADAVDFQVENMAETLNIDTSSFETVEFTMPDFADAHDPKPQPDLGFKSHKYQEDKGIEDLKEYVSSTYKGHYTNKNSDTQTLDLIHSVGDAESFCRSNALKYLSRYDKKGTAKQDILKAMHYCLLLYYFSGNTKEPDYTNTRYETF